VRDHCAATAWAIHYPKNLEKRGDNRRESRRDARPTYRDVCQLPDRNQNTGGGIIYLNANNKLRLANTIARAEKAEGLELIS
jgi:hypothetical protein